MAHLVTKTELAKLAGVTQAAVTKQTRGALAAAVTPAGQIDAAHPAVVAWLAERAKPKPPPVLPGIDPLFEQALQHCVDSGRWSANSISDALHVGKARGARLREQLAAAGHCPPSGLKVEHPTPRAPAPRVVAPSGYAEAQWEVPDEPEDLAELEEWPLRQLKEVYGTASGFFGWLKGLKELEAVQEKRIKNAQLSGRLISRDIVKAAIVDRIDGFFTQLLTDGATTIASRACEMVKAGEDPQAVRAMVEDQLGSFIRPAKESMRRGLDRAV